VYVYAAVGNALVNRGPHVGWVVLSGVIALALLGF